MLCVCVCYVCDGMTNDVQSYVRTFWRALWRHLGGGTWLKALESTPGIGQAVSSDASHIVSRSPSSADVGESRSTSCNGTSLLLSPPYCEEGLLLPSAVSWSSFSAASSPIRD